MPTIAPVDLLLLRYLIFRMLLKAQFASRLMGFGTLKDTTADFPAPGQVQWGGLPIFEEVKSKGSVVIIIVSGG